MRIRNLFLYILFLSFFSFLSIQIVSAATVGMTIKKNGPLLNEENLYWAYAFDTSSDSSSVNSSLIKLQVQTDDGLEDRFRVDKTGNLDASGEITASAFCIEGVAPAPPTCQSAWSGLSGVWNEKGDGELFYNPANVGIGTADPKYTLDVFGKIGVNDVQAIYVPDHTDFQYSLILGDGGTNLLHNIDLEGFENTFVGMGVGSNNTTGFRNTFLGALAGSNNTIGDNNTFVGMYAGNLNVNGIRNTFVGTQSGADNVSGSYNVYMGWGSGENMISGSENTIIGYGAGYNNITGSGNVFIGYNAGNSETGSNKLYIDNSGTATPLIGGDFASEEVYLNANVGIDDLSPSVKLSVNGGVKVGYSTTCENGVLRFNSVKGEFEYCFGGAWRGITSGEIVGDITFETWTGNKSGNAVCGAINTGCIESFNSGGTPITCGKVSNGGTVTCDDSKLSVVWSSARAGHRACSNNTTGCEYSFDSGGSYQSCGLSSSSGSAVCNKNTLSVYWSTADRSNGNYKCAAHSKGCDRAYNSSNAVMSCGLGYNGGTVICNNETTSVYWDDYFPHNGNDECAAIGKGCIESFTWEGFVSSCGTNLTGYGYQSSASAICK